MSFDSPLYLVFLLIVVLLYRLLSPKARPVLLLAASAVFYGCWNVPLTLLLYSVILLTFLAGMYLEKTETKHARQSILVLSVAICVGLLLYFKYFRFLAETLHAVFSAFGYTREWKLWDIILPVGVSFYTFQAMSYVIDVYRGTRQAEKSFLYYALFISFFPQLVAGPIERADALLPQLHNAPTADREQIREGMRLLLSGLFRKIVIADFCGIYVDRIFAAEAPDGSAVLAGAILFSIQIYCDFAGYSEIARGSARLLGIRLMQNFDRPYLSENLRTFWRRWHISLSRWLTDYIYIPMGGAQKGIGRQILATMTVFLISGLWHGANMTFVIWGLLHGTGVVLTMLWSRMHRPMSSSRIRTIVSAGMTFTVVTLLWILFRTQSLSQAGVFYRQLFSGWDIVSGLELIACTWEDALRLLLSLMTFPLLHRLEQKRESLQDIAWLFLVIVIAYAWVIRYSQSGASAFIYFQF